MKKSLGLTCGVLCSVAAFAATTATAEELKRIPLNIFYDGFTDQRIVQ